MEERKEQGIFIPLEIWTIKNLNINEKLTLSDIYNKSQLKDFKGYNKKAETLAIELTINENTAKDIFNSLQKKGYIISDPEIYRNQGSFKKTLPHRHIKQDNFLNAERFIIPEDNIFLRNGVKGVFLSSEDIKILNGWFIQKGNREIKSQSRTRHLILILIIRKVAFIHKKSLEMFARFNIQDIANFLGMSRQKMSRYITGSKDKDGKIKTQGLTEPQSYKKTENKKIEIRFLYKLSDLEAYQELYNKLDDTSILTEYKRSSKVIEVITAEGEIEEITIGDVGNLYYINISDMIAIGMYINIRAKCEWLQTSS